MTSNSTIRTTTLRLLLEILLEGEPQDEPLGDPEPRDPMAG
ncbi:hypothetical protein [Streptomyces endocoffeicus]|nr:hypothetical protein [Streptomyces endocoffeicus]